MSELVGVAEIAELLGVGRQQAHRLIRRPDFPEPLARLAAGSVWRREDVQRWADGTERRRGRPRRQPD